MYMGELVRQVLVDLMKDDLIFVGADRSQPHCQRQTYLLWQGKQPKAHLFNTREKLLERGSFFTRYASEIESDPVGEYTRARY